MYNRTTLGLVLMLLSTVAMATGKTPPPPEPNPVSMNQDMAQEQGQNQLQGQDQLQGQEQTQANSLTNDIDASSIASVSSMSDQANSQSVNYQSAPSIVLVPNNNTENCLRVIGLSFANTSGGGGLGIPYRSRKCDLEQSADDAFAQGNLQLGWFFKCQNKNVYKTFARSKARKNQMIDACVSYAWKMLVPQPLPRDEETVIRVDIDGLPANQCCANCGDHPEVHERIFEKCQQK